MVPVITKLAISTLMEPLHFIVVFWISDYMHVAAIEKVIIIWPSMFRRFYPY